MNRRSFLKFLGAGGATVATGAVATGNTPKLSKNSKFSVRLVEENNEPQELEVAYHDPIDVSGNFTSVMGLTVSASALWPFEDN